MKCKVVEGKSFGGLCRYVYDHGQPEPIGGNLATRDVAHMTAEYTSVAKLRPDVQNSVLHIALSLPAGDHLTPEQWQDVTAQYMQKMGIDPNNHQYSVTRHSDKACEHVHIIINRVNLDGKLWRDNKSAKRSIEACRQLEQELPYLRETQQTQTPGVPRYTTAERKGRKAKGKTCAKDSIADAIKTELRDKPTPQQFIERLAEQGIEALPTVNAKGVQGFAFKDADGRHFSGKDVGYAWRYLAPMLDYQPSRDDAWLKEKQQQRKDIDQLKDITAEYADSDNHADFWQKISAYTYSAGTSDRLKRLSRAEQARAWDELRSAYAERKAASAELWHEEHWRSPYRSMRAQDLGGITFLCAACPLLAAQVLLPLAIHWLSEAQKSYKKEDIQRRIDLLATALQQDKAMRQTQHPRIDIDAMATDERYYQHRQEQKAADRIGDSISSGQNQDIQQPQQTLQQTLTQQQTLKQRQKEKEIQDKWRNKEGRATTYTYQQLERAGALAPIFDR